MLNLQLIEKALSRILKLSNMKVQSLLEQQAWISLIPSDISHALKMDPLLKAQVFATSFPTILQSNSSQTEQLTFLLPPFSNMDFNTL